jgi:tetratricopeptide (TPR) repeat protein
VPQEKPDALELYRQGQFAQAVQVCLQELQERGPDQPRRRMDSYTVLGWSYLRLGQYENALTSARNARNEVRYDERIVEIEAEALFFLGRNIESLSLFEEYVSLSPTGQRIDLAYYYMGRDFSETDRVLPCRHRFFHRPAPQSSGGPVVGASGIRQRTAGGR